MESIAQTKSFNELSHLFRPFEKAADLRITDLSHLVVRLDGRGFSRFTEEHYEKPFDLRFHKHMLATVEALEDSGFKVDLAYTQSDEISLLLDARAGTFAGRSEKLISLLAGTASAAFTYAAGIPAVFDCRMLALNERSLFVDYFHWRLQDSVRNCLNAVVYWKLRNAGEAAEVVHEKLMGKNSAWKREFLDQSGSPWETVPGWQKSGTLVWFYPQIREGVNRLTGEATSKVVRVRQVEEGCTTALLDRALAVALPEDDSQ